MAVAMVVVADNGHDDGVVGRGGGCRLRRRRWRWWWREEERERREMVVVAMEGRERKLERE